MVWLIRAINMIARWKDWRRLFSVVSIDTSTRITKIMRGDVEKFRGFTY